MESHSTEAALFGWFAWVAVALLAAFAIWKWWRAEQSLRGLARRPETPPVDSVVLHEIEVARAQMRAVEQRLREVLDAIPGAVALFDNQDHLIGLNREAAFHPPYRDLPTAIGMSYEDLMRKALAAGLVPDASGREEEWLALRLARRANPSPLRHVDEGHWVHSCEIRTPSGYLVMTRLDIAPLVEKGLALERAHEQLLRVSTTDGLTGIANRRQFELTLQGEWKRSARGQTNLSLLVVDIDHFRAYNDHYGHLAGDECLRQVARVLGLSVKRSGELVARHDGAGFAILLPGADTQEARRVALRCLQQMQSARIPHAGSAVAPWVSVSIGVATQVATPAGEAARLLDEAALAVLHAKQAGRARLEVYEAQLDSAPVSLPAAL